MHDAFSHGDRLHNNSGNECRTERRRAQKLFQIIRVRIFIMKICPGPLIVFFFMVSD